MRTAGTHRSRSFSILAGIALCSLSASATPLDQLESTLNIQNTIDAAIWTESNDIGGVILVDALADIKCGDPATTSPAGRVNLRVIRSNLTNFIHYYWRVEEVTTGHTVERLTIGNFGAGILDAHYRPDGLGTEGVRLYHANRDTAGNIDLFFSTVDGSRAGVYPGESSKFALLKSFESNYRQENRSTPMTPTGHRLSAEVFIGGASTATTCEIYSSGSTFAPVYVPNSAP